MSLEDAKSSTRSKPMTRSSSLRQSLTSAVGKAISASRGRDSSDDTKPAKKPKLSSSRRRSSVVPAQPPQPAAPRPSLGDLRPTQREATPELKSATRRRVSAAPTRSSTEEPAMKPVDSARTTTARPRTATTSSVIPKYRPKSQAIEPTKPATPTRTGTRRRLSTSSEDGAKEQQKPGTKISPKEKDSRPISPLPHRAALKASSVVNTTPPLTPSTPSSRLKPPTLSGNRSSPTRPAKVLKINPVLQPAARPSSSASSVSNSFTPRTPKGSTLKAALTRSAKDKTITGTSPIRNSPMTPSRDSPSPLARRARSIQKHSNSSSSHVGNMSHISEANSEDSEEDDVMQMLAPVANLGAPTPAMPRIRTRRHDLLETPSREKPQPKDKSRLAPPSLLMPSASTRQPQPRPLRLQASGSSTARQSILSWEQLSNDASRMLGEGELERMIADIPAPFSGPTSPALSSIIDIPPSPCLSAIDSPGGFGSISQVLLPDVTPSPAVFLNASARFSVSPEAAGESSATYLRLQLVAVETLANERLLRLQAMEEELHNLKLAHAQQMEEMSDQMAFMERDDERSGYTASLEEQLRASRMNNERAVESAVMKTEAIARAQQGDALRNQRCRFNVTCAAVTAESAWTSVMDASKAEMETIQGERETLALLLAELENIDLFS